MAIAGVILAGGRSTRMGGEDKAFVPLRGEPLMAHACRRVAGMVGDALAINSNGDPARFAPFGFAVIADSFAGWPGPLAGVHAGLGWASARGAARLLTAAVDTPLLPPDLLERLAAAPAHAIAVAATGGRRHPTAALWPVALAGTLEEHLRSGGSRRVNDFISAHPHEEVDFPALGADGLDPFFNVNTPADLARVERHLAGAAS